MSTGLGSTGLAVDRLAFRRDGRLVVDGVDITVRPGTFAALVGPNGAGKTTLLHLLAGIETAAEGAVRLDGAPLGGMRRRERARRIALAEQHADPEVDLLVSEVVLLGRTPHVGVLGSPGDRDRRVVEQALAAAGVAALADRRYSTLSGGERQRVGLAKALAQEPALLLLDEPTNHLDIRAQLDSLELVRELARGGICVIAALHDLNLAASYADHLVVLAAGRVVAAGPPAQVLTPGLVHSVYGVRAVLLENPLTGAPVIGFAPGSHTACLH